MSLVGNSSRGIGAYRQRVGVNVVGTTDQVLPVIVRAYRPLEREQAEVAQDLHREHGLRQYP